MRTDYSVKLNLVPRKETTQEIVVYLLDIAFPGP